MLEQREHVGDHLVEIDDGALGLFRGVRPRQVEQAVDDAGGAERLLLDLLEQRRARIGRIGVLEQHLRVARNAGQRRVDLVRDAGGEQAERRHLLRDAQLLFHLRALGDVFEDDDGARGRAAGNALQRHRGQVDEQRLAFARAARRRAARGTRCGRPDGRWRTELSSSSDVRIEQAIDGLAEHRRRASARTGARATRSSESPARPAQSPAGRRRATRGCSR